MASLIVKRIKREWPYWKHPDAISSELESLLYITNRVVANNEFKWIPVIHDYLRYLVKFQSLKGEYENAINQFCCGEFNEKCWCSVLRIFYNYHLFVVDDNTLAMSLKSKEPKDRCNDLGLDMSPFWTESLKEYTHRICNSYGFVPEITIRAYHLDFCLLFHFFFGRFRMKALRDCLGRVYLSSCPTMIPLCWKPSPNLTPMR